MTKYTISPNTNSVIRTPSTIQITLATASLTITNTPSRPPTDSRTDHASRAASCKRRAASASGVSVL